jgi:serine/threonine protein phosphatase 1
MAARTYHYDLTMSRRTIAIGDIHGCSTALSRLIEEIQPTEDDTIVTLGDYVDRGPDSRGVIDELLELIERCELVPLIGNHEQMLLDAIVSPDALEFWRDVGGAQTLASYGGSLDQIPPHHQVFFRGLHRHYETDQHFFVHANYDPELALDQQPDRLLFWEHIVHTLPARHRSGKTAIVGHTPQGTGEILDLGHVICIDTYCFGGGWLTALDVEHGDVWQVSREGELRER